jgi:hypothetical protein
MKKLSPLFSLIFSMLLIANPVFAANLPDSKTLDLFNKNNIYYYNPSGACEDEKKTCKQNDGADLTVIGDSILADETTKTKMQSKFTNLSDANYDAKVSRTWNEGIEVAKKMTLKSTVIFELGSNNSDGLSQKDIDNLISAIGPDKTIVLVTNYATAEQYQSGYKQNNDLFRQNANDKIIIADWAAKASTEKPTMDSMTVHPADNEARDLLVNTIFDSLNSSCVTGRAVISGNTAAEKIWSGLLSLGFTKEQAAGIMGNMQHESNNFNPVQHEGSQYQKYWPMNLDGNPEIAYGLGLIQWSFGRRINM